MAKRDDSALGEYVHFYKTNYMRYGIARKGEKAQRYKAPNINRFMENRLQDQKFIDQRSLDILKQRLERNSEQAIDRDKHKLNKAYEEKLNTIFEYLGETAGRSLTDYLYYSSRRGGDHFTTGQYKIIRQRALSPQELEMRNSRLLKLADEINEIRTAGVATVKDVKNFLQKLEAITGANFSKVEMPKEEPESLLGSIQSAALEYMEVNTKSAIVGYFGELWAATADDHAVRLSGDNLLTQIKKLNVGSHGSKFSIVESNLASGVIDAIKDANIENTLFKTHYSKNKVDIKMTVNNENVLANVKTYFNASQVTLQSKVGLLESLIFMEENYEKFGTHWLNMHAGVLKGRKREEMDGMLERELAYEALVVGNPLKKDQDGANVFIHINRATGEVEVSSTKDLLIDQFSRFRVSPSPSDVVLNNIWHDFGPEARIARLLIEAHQFKFQVKLASSF